MSMDEERIGAVSTCNKTQIYWYCFFNREFNAHPWIFCRVCTNSPHNELQIAPTNCFLLLLPPPRPDFSPGKRAHLNRKAGNLWCKQAATFQTVSSRSALAFSGLVNNVATHPCSFMHANITYPHSPPQVISKIITISKWSIFFNSYFSACVQSFISNQGLISHMAGLPGLISIQCN